MFVRSIVNQIACAVSVPLNIALCNSADLNYASGRLDQQGYHKTLDVERSYFEIEVLDRILAKWFDEAVFVDGLIPSELGPLDEIPHTWTWDGREHVDPAKEGKGQQSRLVNGTSHRELEYDKVNRTIEEEDPKAAAGYGVTVQEYRQGVFRSTFGVAGNSENVVDDKDDKDEEDGEESQKTETAGATA